MIGCENESLFSLAGKTVLVTGASSGIGQSTAMEVARAGGRVMACGRNEERLQKVLESLQGEGHEFFPGDLLDPKVAKELAVAAGDLDGVVHCAGISRVAPLRFTSDKVLREQIETNVEAPVRLSRELIKKKKIRDGASFVFLSSLSVDLGTVGHVAYAASKAALLGASRSMASEFCSRGIRSNCLLPGMVRTPMLLGGGVSSKDHDEGETGYPFGYGKALDVAGAIVFFLSDASRWVTGQALAMDGGVTLNNR